MPGATKFIVAGPKMANNTHLNLEGALEAAGEETAERPDECGKQPHNEGVTQKRVQQDACLTTRQHEQVRQGPGHRELLEKRNNIGMV